MDPFFPAVCLLRREGDPGAVEEMTTSEGRIGVIGATSLIGEYLLPLLVREGYDVEAFSRRTLPAEEKKKEDGVIWRCLQADHPSDDEMIVKWICLAPIWVLPAYFDMLLSCGVEHVVAFSSTSRFTKCSSSDAGEARLANLLMESEDQLTHWADQHRIRWTLLRPTMVYGLGRDQNVSAIARFIRRFSFFPLWGEARGLRQPVHAQDAAWCGIASLRTEKAYNRSYNISGGETLAYRDMIERIFAALGKKPRFINFPLWLFRMTFSFLRPLSAFRHWSPAMIERLNRDLIFNHHDAAADLNFSPRPFQPTPEDLSA
jgi:nucleoside-diphosphate-sugar epimerase